MARQSRSTGPRLRVDVLGPLRLVVDGAEVDVPGPLRRAVLARLALAGGRSVSVEELLDDIWADQTPDSGKRALHSHISRLRGHLGAAGDRLERTPNGYRLHLAAEELDAAEVQHFAAAARELVTSDPVEAIGLLRRALDGWRGAPLEEFPEVASLAAEAVQLTELGHDLEDDLLAARLAAGGDPDLAADALRSAAARPLRERTHLLTVEILARTGRQADAMRAAHQFREQLADATGFDPTPAFAALERAVATGELARPGEPLVPQPTSPVVLGPTDPGPDARAVRLTRPEAPLVGRSHELSSLRHLVDSQRLVTVVGPGGIGKTRLTLEVAADLAAEPDATARTVTLLELAVIEDPAHMPEALRAALGLRTPANEDVLAAAIGVLATGRPVVVLDNCEHLADACRDLVSALLGACPGLTVLATSREPLGLAGEHVLRLGPLPVPGPDGAPADQLAAIPAVLAFTEFAARRSAGFAPSPEDLVLIGDIVRRLANLRAARDVALARSLIEPLITVTVELLQFSVFRGLPELWEWALELAARSELQDHPARARVLGAAAAAASHRGEFDVATSLAAQALAAARQRGDRFLALHARARVALARAELEQARRSWMEAHADDPRPLPTYESSAALAAAYAGDLDGATALLDIARARAEELGAPGETAFCEYVRGEITAVADPPSAFAAYESATVLARQAGSPFVEGISAVGRVSLLARTGRTAEALAGYGSLLEHWRLTGNWTQLWATIRNLALLLAQEGRANDAALLLAAANSAPDAPAVAGSHAAELEATEHRLRTELGDAAVRALQDRARRLQRPEVLDIAYGAIAAARKA